MVNMSKSRIRNLFGKFSFKKAVWLSPIIYLMHIIEEAVFGFYKFMNKHREEDMTLQIFLIANMMIMLGYIFLITLFTLKPIRLNAFFVLALLSAAQFFNTFFPFCVVR